jgi:hypothetical protein
VDPFRKAKIRDGKIPHYLTQKFRLNYFNMEITREQFMEFFRSEDLHNKITVDDAHEIFTGILHGDSDLTEEVFQGVINNYCKGVTIKFVDCNTVDLSVYRACGYFEDPQSAKDYAEKRNKVNNGFSYIAVERSGHFEVWAKFNSKILAELL